MKPRGVRVSVGFLLVTAIAGAIFLFTYDPLKVSETRLTELTFEELSGSLFLPSPKNPFHPPTIRDLTLPPAEDATSVWGSIGRGPHGRIWVGVSATSDGMSAHLLEYNPEADQWRDTGGVVDQLKSAGLYHQGEGQIKIHSRIIPANDGWLYFSSTDEEGESAQGAVPPRWGGHLWRIHPESHSWQHLAAVPEGLIAVSGVGRYVYALGYWGHVLYQYDTATRTLKRVAVGSVGGHVSRNFLADARGHAYVPRLGMRSDGSVSAALVEYDEDLRELGDTPLEFYLDKGSPESNHGIVGFAYLPDGRIAFTTHRGYLYVVDPQGANRAAITAIGWFHPQGEAYAPSLFSLGGNTWLAGVTQRDSRFEWVVMELQTHVSGAFPFDTKVLQKVLLYGSISRDDAGRSYVGGWASNGNGGQRPLVLQIDAGH